MLEDILVIAIIVTFVTECALILFCAVKAAHFIQNLKTRLPSTWIALGSPEPAWYRYGWTYDPRFFNYLRYGEFSKLQDRELVTEGKRINTIFRIQALLFVALAVLVLAEIFVPKIF
ncbi:MAG: hypothetical protein KGK44_09490 [Gammaproteobacteria bacterium]|nr:hypothetical protein [Gammaproteobacteria bacterium]